MRKDERLFVCQNCYRSFIINLNVKPLVEGYHPPGPCPVCGTDGLRAIEAEVIERTES